MTRFPTLERPESIARAINSRYLAEAPPNARSRAEDPPLVRWLRDRARLSPEAARHAGSRALELVQAVRNARGSGGGVDAFLREYRNALPEGNLPNSLGE